MNWIFIRRDLDTQPKVNNGSWLSAQLRNDHATKHSYGTDHDKTAISKIIVYQNVRHLIFVIVFFANEQS